MTGLDAITLSLAQLPGDGVERRVVALAILVAVWSNTALKCLLVMALGSRPLRGRTLVAAAVSTAAGALAFALS